MKKFIIGVMVLTSFTVFAQDSFMIINKTTPAEKIAISCETESCDFVTVTHLIDEEIIKERRLDSEDLRRKAEHKLELELKCKKDIFWDGPTPGIIEFGVTREFTAGAKKNWNRGYEVVSALQYTFLGITGLFMDVAISPFILPMHAASCINTAEGEYSKSKIKWAKKTLKAIEKGFKKGNISLKERRFNKVYSYLF